MDILWHIINFFLALDQHLIQLILTYDKWAYALLFIIIFCETGLIIFPFLPGDSLLFVAGSLSALSTCVLNVTYLAILLISSSFLGNWMNYHVGYFIGERVLSMQENWFWKPKYVMQAHLFYKRHGRRAIVLARFVPIIRTFVPFVAGIARMDYRIFLIYNLISAVSWILSLLLAGYFLGKIPFIQLHLNMLIYSIILISLLPGLWMFIRQKYCTIPLN